MPTTRHDRAAIGAILLGAIFAVAIPAAFLADRHQARVRIDPPATPEVSAVHAEAASHGSTDLEARVDELMTDFSGDDTPGVVIGVVDHGELVFEKAYGMANLVDGIPFESDTRSNIGSVTKQFTAMGLLLLEAEGKLALEDDLGRHIPEIKDFGKPVTVRNLLHHTGGYREIYNLLPMTGYRGEDALSRRMAVQVVQRQPELQARPNTEFNYNNTGYILLATAIERVTGMTFPEYMQARVFEPLGMMDTRVKMGQGEIIPHSALGYAPLSDGRFRQTRDLAAAYGAGGIYTTVGDLAKWMMNYRDGIVGGHEAVSAITTPAVLENGESTGYGLGMGTTTHRGRTLYTHTGGDVAHRAYFGYYPELESGVVIMSNHAAFDLSVGVDLAELFFGDEMDPIAEKGTVESAVLDALLDAPLESVRSILAASALPDPAPAQEPSRELAQGEERGRTGAEGPDAQGALDEFEGRYYSEELETAYEIHLEEGILKAHSFRVGPLTLTRVEGDEFTGSAAFFASVAFKRSDDGKVSGFMASNGRTRNVWFGREN